MSRELVAKQELDKAEVRLRKNSDLVRQLTEFLKDALSGADMSFTGLEKYVEINGKRYTKPELDELKGAAGYVGIGKALAGIVDDIADGQSFGHTVVGAAVDFGLIAITKFIPVVSWITPWYDIGNLLDKLDGKDSGIFDLRKQAQNLWDKITGDGLSDIDMNALQKRYSKSNNARQNSLCKTFIVVIFPLWRNSKRTFNRRLQRRCFIGRIWR